MVVMREQEIVIRTALGANDPRSENAAWPALALSPFLMPHDRPVENVAGLRVGTGVEILRYRPFWGGPRLARLKSYAQTCIPSGSQ